MTDRMTFSIFPTCMGIVLLMATVFVEGSEGHATEAARISETVESDRLEQPLLSEEEKQKLEEEAKRLSRDLQDLFRDLSGVSRQVADTVIGALSQWIEENYGRLSELKQEKLREFIGRLEKEYSGLRDMTREKWRQLEERIDELLRMLQEAEKPVIHEEKEDKIFI